MPTVYALAARWLPYLLLALAMVAGYWYISSDAAAEARTEVLVQQQTETLAAQAITIGQLKADMALQAQLVLDAQSKAKLNADALAKVKPKLKEVMKNEACADVPVPTAAIERLRQYTTGKD